MRFSPIGKPKQEYSTKLHIGQIIANDDTCYRPLNFLSSIPGTSHRWCPRATGDEWMSAPHIQSSFYHRVEWSRQWNMYLFSTLEAKRKFALLVSADLLLFEGARLDDEFTRQTIFLWTIMAWLGSPIIAFPHPGRGHQLYMWNPELFTKNYSYKIVSCSLNIFTLVSIIAGEGIIVLPNIGVFGKGISQQERFILFKDCLIYDHFHLHHHQ